MEDDIFAGQKVIDATPRKRRWWLWITLAIVLAVLFFGSQFLGIYVDALWFSSVGFADVYWYKFRIGGSLFLIFFILTFAILRISFALLTRALPQLTERPRVRLAALEDLRDINVLPLIYRPGVWIVSIGMALLTAVNLAGSWSDFALFLNSSPTGVADPIFNKDISFYLFSYPVLELISDWLTSIAAVLWFAVAAVAGYLWYIESARGFSTDATRKRAIGAISGATAFLAAVLAFNSYLSRFDLLQSQHDLFVGASYTDANVLLPGLTILIIALAAAAVIFAANAVSMQKGRPMVWAAIGVAVIWLTATVLVPSAIHSFSVKPNELAKESPYITHNIEMTRRAFGLEAFQEHPFVPAPNLTTEQITANRPTIDNVRLWDPKVLNQTLSQIQEIRQYYDFGMPDVDRYVLNGRKREVMIATREMNVDKLPEQSRNWINQHIVYTHGYGLAMATVNEFTPEGLPHLVLKNMPVASDAPELKVTRPEIYFGEETNSHVYVHTRPQATTAPEFNFPAEGSEGNADSYTQYEGTAGIPVGGALRKLLFAIYLGDGSNLLFSDYINSQSLVLMHRNISKRVQKIAPFLALESDPYVVIDGDGKLVWMIDAFTYSQRYPYSASYAFGGTAVNYLRNSVKVTVDAYTGEVSFYVFDDTDPIVRAYQRIFPSLFKPASQMPASMRAHIRFPNSLAQVQARAYALYHMTNPQTFYNHEDLWAVATEEASASASGQSGGEAQAMRPYYVLMQLPDQPPSLEFVNILPFTPAGAGRNNMIGWMAGRCDGDEYGHSLVFTFPKNVTVNGPAQIRARVNQDPKLSAQMTLWNQKGSELLRGNLLVIPIADSLLYVEPFFLQASSSPLPELRQVAMATQEHLSTGKDFPEALAGLFPGLGSQVAAQTGQTSGTGQTGQAGQPPPGAAQSPGQGSPPANQSTQQGQPAANQNAGPAGSDSAKLAQQAQQLLNDYGRLTAEGKFKEAGEKLDQLNQILNQIAHKSGN